MSIPSSNKLFSSSQFRDALKNNRLDKLKQWYQEDAQWFKQNFQKMRNEGAHINEIGFLLTFAQKETLQWFVQIDPRLIERFNQNISTISKNIDPLFYALNNNPDDRVYPYLLSLKPSRDLKNCYGYGHPRVAQRLDSFFKEWPNQDSAWAKAHLHQTNWFKYSSNQNNDLFLKKAQKWFDLNLWHDWVMDSCFDWRLLRHAPLKLLKSIWDTLDDEEKEKKASFLFRDILPVSSVQTQNWIWKEVAPLVSDEVQEKLIEIHLKLKREPQTRSIKSEMKNIIRMFQNVDNNFKFSTFMNVLPSTLEHASWLTPEKIKLWQDKWLKIVPYLSEQEASYSLATGVRLFTHPLSKKKPSPNQWYQLKTLWGKVAFKMIGEYNSWSSMPQRTSSDKENLNKVFECYGHGQHFEQWLESFDNSYFKNNKEVLLAKLDKKEDLLNIFEKASVNEQFEFLKKWKSSLNKQYGNHLVYEKMPYESFPVLDEKNEKLWLTELMNSIITVRANQKDFAQCIKHLKKKKMFARMEPHQVDWAKALLKSPKSAIVNSDLDQSLSLMVSEFKTIQPQMLKLFSEKNWPNMHRQLMKNSLEEKLTSAPARPKARL